MGLDYFNETWFIALIIIFFIWEMIWKLIAMWKAGRNNHLAWYILLALINTAGILPIIYIVMNRKKTTVPPPHY